MCYQRVVITDDLRGIKYSGFTGLTRDWTAGNMDSVQENTHQMFAHWLQHSFIVKLYFDQ